MSDEKLLSAELSEEELEKVTGGTGSKLAIDLIEKASEDLEQQQNARKLG